MASVFNVAAYVLEHCGKMTTMKLQKLVYYCQAWSLAWDDVPLFDEDFEAWANGPVCPDLFQKHKGWFVIEKDFFSEYSGFMFEEEQLDTMNAVLNQLGDKSPQWLSDLTHSELPWKQARAGYDVGEICGNVITKESMQMYYSELSCQ